MCVQTNAADTKIRNCILLNPVGDGIYCTWQGKNNEIVNNFIVNTFYAAIETRSAQPDSVILIKNNTIVYGWSYPTMGGGDRRLRRALGHHDPGLERLRLPPNGGR